MINTAYENIPVIIGAATVIGASIVAKVAKHKYPAAPELYLRDLRDKITQIVYDAPAQVVEDFFRSRLRAP